MTLDDKTYLEMVRLGRSRARDASLSVLQLIDDDEQRIGLLVNIAVEIAGAAVEYLQREMKTSEEDALKRVISGFSYGLGADKYFAKKPQHSRNRSDSD